MKKFLIILFLAFVGSINAQQKANYALAERFRELITMPIVKYSLLSGRSGKTYEKVTF